MENNKQISFSLKNWKISSKITSIVVLMIIILLAAITLISDYSIRKTITKEIEGNFELTTHGVNNSISEYLLNFINQLGTLSVIESVQTTIEKSNDKYKDSKVNELNKILKMDTEWINGSNSLANMVVTEDYVKNPAAHDLIHFVDKHPEHIEILITDKYGALVAATNKTSDYYQADEAWWQEAWANGRGGFHISKPAFDESIGKTVVMITFAVYSDSNEPIGIIRTNIVADNIFNITESSQNGETGRAALIDQDGEALITEEDHHHYENLIFSNKQNNLKKGIGITNDELGNEVIYGFYKFDASETTNINTLQKENFLNEVADLNWYVVFSQETDEAFEVIKTINNVILWTGLALLLIFIVISIFVVGKLINPLITIISNGRKIIDGDLSGTIDYKSNDEIGQLSKMFNDLVISLNIMAESAKSISEGDLSVHVEPRSDQDEMGKAFKNMAESLREQINEINEVVSTLTSSNSQLMATVAEASSTSSETVTTVSEITTTIEEVKQTAEVSAQKANTVAESANKSVQISEKGIKSTEDSIESMAHIQEQVKQIADTIIKLSEQSQTIGDITSTVNDLAEQSNLLAVNASIEAVKAGEYGKGFGVVAQEIRALADQSKQATKQIKDILNEVQKVISSAVMATEQGGKAVDQGVSLAETSGDVISMLADSIAEASQASTQIAASSHQQLVGMEQLATAMENIKLAAQQNETGNKETENAVANLKDIVGRLKDLTNKYKL